MSTIWRYSRVSRVHFFELKPSTENWRYIVGRDRYRGKFGVKSIQYHVGTVGKCEVHMTLTYTDTVVTSKSRT